MKKSLLVILLVQACSSTSYGGQLKTVSPKMSCVEINEQIAVANEIISVASGGDINTNVARSGVSVGSQAASVAGVGAYGGLMNSIFSLGTTLYDKDRTDIKRMAQEAEDKKLDLETLFYEKKC